MNKNVNPQTVIQMVASNPNATAETLCNYFQYYSIGEPDDFQVAQFEALQLVNNIKR